MQPLATLKAETVYVTLLGPNLGFKRPEAFNNTLNSLTHYAHVIVVT
jgi:hypothetical protein